MADLQYNITPQDITALLRVSEQFSNNLDRYGQIFSDQQSNIAKSREDYASLMKRLLDKEDNAPTGNPFTDMLNGYIRMKKQSNPDYQWQGALPLAGKGLGWLGKQAGAGMSGLFSMLRGGQGQQPFSQVSNDEPAARPLGY